MAGIVRASPAYEIVGFLDDVHSDRHGQEFCEAPVLGGREQLGKLLAGGVRHAIIGFGDNGMRRTLAQSLVSVGFELGRALHPRATIAPDVTLGAGTVIVAGAVVNPNATIGANVIVNTCASVDHDCVLGDAVHVAPGARLAGGVRVDSESWIGLGAVVLEGRTIGPGTMVGAGAVVTRDLPGDVVAHGSPARIIRRRAGPGLR